MVHAENRLTAVLGVKDLVIVSTADAVLVAPRGHAEDVKHLVATLKQAGHAEATNHRRVHRPWGYYESVDRGERFQVKRLLVAPKGKLSLQKHLHRAEHWVVVRGTAEVTIDDKVSLYTRMSPSTCLSGRFIGMPIRARSPSSLWRCNRAITLAKTISSVSTTSTVAIKSDPICPQAMNAQLSHWLCRLSRRTASREPSCRVQRYHSTPL